MAMKGTVLFISAMGLAAAPIFVVLSQDSSVDQEVRAPGFAAATSQQGRLPVQITRGMHRTDPRAQCTQYAHPAHASCSGRR
jgi:hypothetical protein